jgi:serine/threonine protein kinase
VSACSGNGRCDQSLTCYIYGCYTLPLSQGLLGEGAYGFVYAGVDKSNGERVAIKVSMAIIAERL